MRKKSLVRLASTVVAIPLAITMFPTTAFADDPTPPYSWTPEDQGHDNVVAVGNGTDTEYVSYRDDVTATGESAVIAKDKGSVYIEGTVSGDTTPIISVDNGTVNVNGSVTMSGNSNTTAVEFKGNSNVNISSGSSFIYAGTYAVEMYIDSNTSNGSFTSNGYIDANGTSFGIHKATGFTGNIDSSNIADYLPEINVYRISGAANPGVYVLSDEFGVTDPEEAQRMNNAVLEHLNYIVHMDSPVMVPVNVSGSNASINQSIRSMVTKYVSPESLAANPDSGFLVYLDPNYSLETESYESTPVAQVTPLNTTTSEGMAIYRVVLTNTKGGLYLKAIRRQIAEATGVPESQVSLVVETSQNSDSASPSEIPSDAVVVSTPASGTPAAPAVPGAEAPSRAVTLNITQLTPVQYQNAIVNNVAATPAGTTFRISTNRMACFDKRIISAFKANPNVNVEVLFPYGGQMLRVVIPRGYDVTKLLDEKGYCGFLRLASLLGSEVVG